MDMIQKNRQPKYLLLKLNEGVDEFLTRVTCDTLPALDIEVQLAETNDTEFSNAVYAALSQAVREGQRITLLDQKVDYADLSHCHWEIPADILTTVINHNNSLNKEPA